MIDLVNLLEFRSSQLFITCCDISDEAGGQTGRDAFLEAVAEEGGD